MDFPSLTPCFQRKTLLHSVELVDKRLTQSMLGIKVLLCCVNHQTLMHVYIKTQGQSGLSLIGVKGLNPLVSIISTCN